MQDVPNHIKRELEKLQEAVAPLLKKVSKYTLWTFPLIGVSIFNLFFLIFFTPINEQTIPTIFIFAILGAVGMALLKEVKIQRQEIQKLSEKYIIERMKSSEIATDHHKREYLNLIKNQPIAKTMNHFIQFLMEEENRKKMIED